MIRKLVFCPLWTKTLYENINQLNTSILPAGAYWLTEWWLMKLYIYFRTSHIFINKINVNYGFKNKMQTIKHQLYHKNKVLIIFVWNDSQLWSVLVMLLNQTGWGTHSVQDVVVIWMTCSIIEEQSSVPPLCNYLINSMDNLVLINGVTIHSLQGIGHPT